MAVMTLVQTVPDDGLTACILALLLPPGTTFAKKSNTRLFLQLTYAEALACL